MKKCILILLLILFGSFYLPLMAQLSKGQGFISGSLSFYNNNYRSTLDQKSSNGGAGINVLGGRFIKDKLAYTLGVNLYESNNTGFNLAYTQVETRPDGQALYISQQVNTQNSYFSTDLSLGLNRYISLQERFAVILSGSFTAGFESSESTEKPQGQVERITKWKQHDFSLNFNPGLIYFLSPRFGVSGYFGGLSLRFEPKTEQNYASTFSGSFSTSGVLGIGLNYFFK